MEKISLTYAAFKQLVFVDCKGMRYKAVLENADPKDYWVFCRDGDGIMYETSISDPTDVSDFETNYLAGAKKNLAPIEEVSGALRTYIREVEGTLNRHHVYFTTGDADSLRSRGKTEYSIDCSTAGKTVIDFSPTYGYFVDGGRIRIRGAIPTGHEVICKIIAAPGTPYAKVFCDNIIFDDVDISDGHRTYEEKSPAKNVIYYAQATSRIRLEVEHNADDRIKIEFYLHVFPY